AAPQSEREKIRELEGGAIGSTSGEDGPARRSRSMGKQRRKFETGFKQQIVQEVESGLLAVSAASRKYQISGSVIDRWRRQARQGGLQAAPSVREKFLERENRELKEKLAELYLE